MMFGRHCPIERTSCVFHNAGHINAQCNFIFSAHSDPDSTQFHRVLKRHGCQNVWHHQCYCVWTWTILIGYGGVAKAPWLYHQEQSLPFAKLLDFDSPIERQKFVFIEGFRVFYVWECESVYAFVHRLPKFLFESSGCSEYSGCSWLLDRSQTLLFTAPEPFWGARIVLFIAPKPCWAAK